MKELKYNDIPGFENTNTPTQLDTFEVRAARGLKDRFIFDFSEQLNFSPYVSSIDPEDIYTYDQFYSNMAYFDSKWDVSYGIPGSATLYVKDFINKNNYPLQPAINKTQSILNEEIKSFEDSFGNSCSTGVPVWNENAAIAIGTKYPSLYGAAALPDDVNTFRSGYFEFTIKTNKQNSIIAYGSLSQNSSINNDEQTALDSSNIILNEKNGGLSEFKIFINNGKLKISYEDKYGNNKKYFDLLSNSLIADDEWHHVVINIGKPGILLENGNKNNKKFIEFWIDGTLDKKTFDFINDSQVFFPSITWLFIDPTLSIGTNGKTWMSADYDTNTDSYIGAEYTYSFKDEGRAISFAGSLNHWISGINTALEPSEIKERNRLYRGYYRDAASALVANAELLDPTIESNKKKALKLFWNNISESKNGIELDSNFSVDSYSVTNKTINSPSEIYNVDIANDKELSFLKDVRVAIKDNVFITKPGSVWLMNFEEISGSLLGISNQSNQYNQNANDSISFPNLAINSYDLTQKFTPQMSTPTVTNITFSGVSLENGDRILLTNQYNPKENGIYTFNGLDNPLTRASDANSSSKIKNAVVRIIDGYYKDTSWINYESSNSLIYSQLWMQLEEHPKKNTIGSQPIFGQKWSSITGSERFIDLEEDLDINKYDIVVFMNYPENNEDIRQYFVNYNDNEIKQKYDNFIKSIKNVAANGASIYVSSPKLAEDLGAVKHFTKITQEVEISDAQSASISPFEVSEPADRYFDTHRQNAYHVDTEIVGLTNKQTYILTDFINYIPNNSYDYEQYHAKYSYRQFGLKEGNEFIIPGLALRKIATNSKLPGFNNRKFVSDIFVVAPSNVLAGTIVTSLANNHYHGSTLVVNEYDDYATTIVIHNNQLLDGQPITGKIFINCIEDGYTFSRQEYNKAVIQVIPEEEISETIATRAWQYSTTRLNRSPKKVDIRELTEYGQTTPTLGGGGAFIQAQTNSSNGVIRSETDKNNTNHESDLYPTEVEEVYPIQEIPVLSMTWLGLQWLAE